MNHGQLGFESMNKKPLTFDRAVTFFSLRLTENPPKHNLLPTSTHNRLLALTTFPIHQLKSPFWQEEKPPSLRPSSPSHMKLSCTSRVDSKELKELLLIKPEKQRHKRND
jgi:hypothetical protein